AATQARSPLRTHGGTYQTKKRTWGTRNGVWVSQSIRDAVVQFVQRWAGRTNLPILLLVGWLGIAMSKFSRWSGRLGTPNQHNASLPRDFWLEDWEKAAIIAFHALYPLVDVHTPKANVQYATLDRKPLKSVRNRHQTNTILNTSHEPKSTTVLELKYRSYEMFTIIQEFTEKYRGFRGSLFSIHPLSGCERLRVGSSRWSGKGRARLLTLCGNEGHARI